MDGNKKKDMVRVRIAPSPTGNFHFGTARTALFNLLWARHEGGQFVLRIEDTDLERSDKKYEADILEQMKWLGFTFDEGPYRQSERLDIYEKYLKQLLNEGKAYYCFCTEEQLEIQRQEDMSRGVTPIYRGTCRGLSADEVTRRHAAGERSVIRFKLQTTNYKLPTITFHDLIRGDVEFDAALIGDTVIAKDMRTPLYNFAVVIDDELMNITHVVRGEDHISNTPKQMLLQQALGFRELQYAHLPLILNPDRSKMSKRAGPTAIAEYRQLGYLPEALINFMAFLGWNPKTEQEFFSLPELIKAFSLEGVGKAGAIFNIEKLNSLNAHYIQQKSLEELTTLCTPYLRAADCKVPLPQGADRSNMRENDEFLQRAVRMAQPRLEKLSDIVAATEFLFTKELAYEPSILVWKKSTVPLTLSALKLLREFFTTLTDEVFEEKILERLLKEMITASGRGVGELLWPLRVALTGMAQSPTPFEVAAVLKKDNVLQRIDKAIKILS